ncbi:MAG: hypothetical protein QM703_13625 [Gemmatales bacterium]
MPITDLTSLLRQLADELDAGKYSVHEVTDEKETVVVGTHKDITVKVNTGRRRIAIDLREADHRPVAIASLLDMCEKAWESSGGQARLEVTASRLGPKARLVRNSSE